MRFGMTSRAAVESLHSGLGKVRRSGMAENRQPPCAPPWPTLESRLADHGTGEASP